MPGRSPPPCDERSTPRRARVLEPADFGALALASVPVNALALFPALGLGTALLAQRENPRPTARSAVTVALCSGALLALIAAGAGALVARGHGRVVGTLV